MHQIKNKTVRESKTLKHLLRSSLVVLTIELEWLFNRTVLVPVSAFRHLRQPALLGSEACTDHAAQALHSPDAQTAAAAAAGLALLRLSVHTLSSGSDLHHLAMQPWS